MGVIGADGAEGQDERTDRLVNISGSISWNSSVPSGSLGIRCFNPTGDYYIPWLLALAGTAWGMRLSWFSSTHSTANYAGASRGSTEVLTVSRTGAGLWTLRIAGSVVATSGVAGQLSTWETITIKVDQQAGGTVSVRVGGVEVISHTLTAGNITAMGGVPTSVYMSRGSSIFRLDDIISVDEDDGTDILDFTAGTVKLDPRTSNGDFTDGTGDYTAIDEIPWSDADRLVFDTAAQKADFGGGTVPSGYSLKAVVVTAAVQRVGTGAGSQIRAYLRESSASLNGTTQAAPLDDVLGWVFMTARDTTAWTSGAYAATTIGLEAVT